MRNSLSSLLKRLKSNWKVSNASSELITLQAADLGRPESLPPGIQVVRERRADEVQLEKDTSYVAARQEQIQQLLRLGVDRELIEMEIERLKRELPAQAQLDARFIEQLVIQSGGVDAEGRLQKAGNINEICKLIIRFGERSYLGDWKITPKDEAKKTFRLRDPVTDINLLDAVSNQQWETLVQYMYEESGNFSQYRVASGQGRTYAMQIAPERIRHLDVEELVDLIKNILSGNYAVHFSRVISLPLILQDGCFTSHVVADQLHGLTGLLSRENGGPGHAEKTNRLHLGINITGSNQVVTGVDDQVAFFAPVELLLEQARFGDVANTGDWTVGGFTSDYLHDPSHRFVINDLGIIFVTRAALETPQVQSILATLKSKPRMVVVEGKSVSEGLRSFVNSHNIHPRGVPLLSGYRVKYGGEYVNRAPWSPAVTKSYTLSTNAVALSLAQSGIASSPLSSLALGKWAQKIVFGMLVSAMSVLAITDNPDPLIRSINQGDIGSLERVLMLSATDSLLPSRVLPNIDYEGLAAKSAQGDGEAFLELLNLYKYIGEWTWGKFVSGTLPGYLKSKISSIDVNVFKDKAINGDCFAIEALFILAKEYRNYDAEGILAGVKLDKLIDKANQGDPQAYVIIGSLADDLYLPVNGKYFSRIDPSALINRYLSGEKNTYFDKAISLYADRYKDGSAKKLVELLLGEANKGNIEVLNTLVNVVAANLEPEEQSDILGKKINPYGLKGKINAENIDLAEYILKTLIERNNTEALNYLFSLAADYKSVKDLLLGYCNYRVLQLRYAHLDERISSDELERRLIQENMGGNPYFLYLAFSSDEMFGDLGKMIFDKLQNMAHQNKFPDVDSYLKSLDPGNMFYTNFVLQSANFSLLGDMIDSPESLGRITKLIFQDLSSDYMKNISARIALFVEKTVENKDFKYQKYFQESLLNLYRLAKDDFHRKFLAGILSLYKEDLTYLDQDAIRVIERNEGVSYRKDDYQIDYKNLFKNGKLVVNLIYSDEDAMTSSFGRSLNFFFSKGYRVVAKTHDRTTIENAPGTVRIVLIDNSRYDSNYDMDKEVSEGARIVSGRNHSGNSGKVYKLLGDMGVVATGLKDKYKDVYFVPGQCRGATIMSELKNKYGVAGVIAVNGTGFGELTDHVIWKFAENLASRKYRNIYEVSQATIEELPKADTEDHVFPSNKAGIFGEVLNKITYSPFSSSPVNATEDFLIELGMDAIASSVSQAVAQSKSGKSVNLLGIYMDGVTTSLSKHGDLGLDFDTTLNKLSVAMQAQGISGAQINQLNQGIRQWQGVVEKLAVAQKQNRENIGLANAQLAQNVEELVVGDQKVVIHGTSIDNVLSMLASGQMIQGEINNLGKGNYFEIAKSGDAYAISPDRTEVLLLFDKDSFIKDHGLAPEKDFFIRNHTRDGVVTAYEFFVIKMDLPMYGDYLKYFKLITPTGVSDFNKTISASSPVNLWSGQQVESRLAEIIKGLSDSLPETKIDALGALFSIPKAVIRESTFTIGRIELLPGQGEEDLKSAIAQGQAIILTDTYNVLGEKVADGNVQLREALQKAGIIDSALSQEPGLSLVPMREANPWGGGNDLHGRAFYSDFVEGIWNLIWKGIGVSGLQQGLNFSLLQRSKYNYINGGMSEEEVIKDVRATKLLQEQVIRICKINPTIPVDLFFRASFQVRPLFLNVYGDKSSLVAEGFKQVGRGKDPSSGIFLIPIGEIASYLNKFGGLTAREKLTWNKASEQMRLFAYAATIPWRLDQISLHLDVLQRLLGVQSRSDLLRAMVRRYALMAAIIHKEMGAVASTEAILSGSENSSMFSRTNIGYSIFDYAALMNRNQFISDALKNIPELDISGRQRARDEASSNFEKIKLKELGILRTETLRSLVLNILLDDFSEQRVIEAQKYFDKIYQDGVANRDLVGLPVVSSALSASSPVTSINVFAGNNQFLPKGRAEILKADLNVCLLVVAMDKDGNRFMAHFLPSGHIQGGLSNPELVKYYFESYLQKMLQDMPRNNVKVAIISSTKDDSLKGLLAELGKNGPAPYLITLEGIEDFLKERSIDIPLEQKDDKNYMKTVTFDQAGNVKITYLDTKEAEKERVVQLGEVRASSAASGASSPVELSPHQSQWAARLVTAGIGEQEISNILSGFRQVEDSAEFEYTSKIPAVRERIKLRIEDSYSNQFLGSKAVRERIAHLAGISRGTVITDEVYDAVMNTLVEKDAEYIAEETRLENEGIRMRYKAIGEYVSKLVVSEPYRHIFRAEPSIVFVVAGLLLPSIEKAEEGSKLHELFADFINRDAQTAVFRTVLSAQKGSKEQMALFNLIFSRSGDNFGNIVKEFQNDEKILLVILEACFRNGIRQVYNEPASSPISYSVQQTRDDNESYLPVGQGEFDIVRARDPASVITSIGADPCVLVVIDDRENGISLLAHMDGNNAVADESYLAFFDALVHEGTSPASVNIYLFGADNAPSRKTGQTIKRGIEKELRKRVASFDVQGKIKEDFTGAQSRSIGIDAKEGTPFTLTKPLAHTKAAFIRGMNRRSVYGNPVQYLETPSFALASSPVDTQMIKSLKAIDGLEVKKDGETYKFEVQVRNNQRWDRVVLLRNNRGEEIGYFELSTQSIGFQNASYIKISNESYRDQGFARLILDEVRKVFPDGKTITTEIASKESLSELEDGKSLNSIGIVRLFESAGWEFTEGGYYDGNGEYHKEPFDDILWQGRQKEEEGFVVVTFKARGVQPYLPGLSPEDTNERSSSPIIKDTKGGIDFRSLPITTQPALNAQLSNMPTPRPLISVNLDESWSQIKNMLKAEIIPSSERIKEYLQACCEKKDMDQEVDKILACIADIIRLQEERVVSTDSSLKEMLALLESNKSANEMQFVLAKIIVPDKELLTIAQ